MTVSKKRLLVTGFCSLVLGVGLTAAVFAAIPNSTTKVISACRNNLSGALKVIDAQSGATCGLFETSLSWSGDLTPPSSGGSKTAIFRLTPDSSDPDFPGVYDPSNSRGVVRFKKLVANDPANNPSDLRGYCLDFDFTVRYSSDDRPGGTISYPAIIGGSAQIDAACGPGFDAYVDNNTGVDRKGYFFSE